MEYIVIDNRPKLPIIEMEPILCKGCGREIWIMKGTKWHPCPQVEGGVGLLKGVEDGVGR